LDLTEPERKLLLVQLTQREGEVLGWLMEDAKSDNHRPLAVVALEHGVNECVFYKAMSSAEDLMGGQKKRFVGWDGKPMLFKKYPAPILELRQVLENNWEVFGRYFETWQIELLDFICQPNEMGYYPTLEDIEKTFGDKSSNWRLYLRFLRMRIQQIMRQEELK
jgi:hypothetical protein